MELKELKEKTVADYNHAYDDAGNGLPALKSDIFRLMSAEELNLSHYLEIEGNVKRLFPITETYDDTNVTHLENMKIELSGKVARVTCNVIIDFIHGEYVQKNCTYKKKLIIYIYKYDNVWYVL